MWSVTLQFLDTSGARAVVSTKMYRHKDSQGIRPIPWHSSQRFMLKAKPYLALSNFKWSQRYNGRQNKYLYARNRRPTSSESDTANMVTRLVWREWFFTRCFRDFAPHKMLFSKQYFPSYFLKYRYCSFEVVSKDRTIVNHWTCIKTTVFSDGTVVTRLMHDSRLTSNQK